MSAVNCWESMKCRYGPGAGVGKTCPSAQTGVLDGVNGGDFRGRICWMVSGTLCVHPERVDDTQPESDCEKCDFYQSVNKSRRWLLNHAI